MMSIADMNEIYAELARPGGWNGSVTITAIERMDMLEKGVSEFVVGFSQTRICLKWEMEG